MLDEASEQFPLGEGKAETKADEDSSFLLCSAEALDPCLVSMSSLPRDIS